MKMEGSLEGGGRVVYLLAPRVEDEDEDDFDDDYDDDDDLDDDIDIDDVDDSN